MKHILMTPTTAKHYLTKPPELTHTKEEMDSLYACIRYTHMFKREESLAKMDEEELIARPLPALPKNLPDIGRF